VFYLPDGTWTNFWTGEHVVGGVWRREQHGYLSVPLYVRSASIVALGQDETRPDYDYASDVELHLFAFQDGSQASTVVYNTQGQPELQVRVHRQGQRLSIQAESVGKAWTVVLRGVAAVESVTGASYQHSAQGVVLVPKQGESHLEVVL
jgi:alpha-D-xyloside xylohydrolase